MTAEIIDGRKIAKNIRADVATEVKKLESKYGFAPAIVTIKIGEDPSSEIYLKLRDNACGQVGIKTSRLEFDQDVSEGEVIGAISKLNDDDAVHGILIQFPTPKHISADKLINALDPKKDVEGFHPQNMGRTLINDEYIIPCTPLAALTILEHEKVNLKGKDVLIVNHSNVVGKPLSILFLNRNATVSVCHEFTKDLQFYSKKADVLISATGIPGFIKGDYVKEGAFLIDVGIVRTKDGITGDVDFESVKDVAGKLTPVPGGVGPVTVACSLLNMVKTFKNCVN